MRKFLVFPDTEPVVIDIDEIACFDASKIDDLGINLEWTFILKSGEEVKVFANSVYYYPLSHIQSAIERSIKHHYMFHNVDMKRLPKEDNGDS